MENGIKGIIVLIVWGLVGIGIAAILPDETWNGCPKKLYPVREFLAENHIISSQFKKSQTDLSLLSQQNSNSTNESSSENELENGSINQCQNSSSCSVSDSSNLSRVKIGKKQKTVSSDSEASSFSDDSLNANPLNLAQNNNSTEEFNNGLIQPIELANASSLSSDFPSDKMELSNDIPEFPVSTTSSGDTLPHMAFHDIPSSSNHLGNADNSIDSFPENGAYIENQSVIPVSGTITGTSEMNPPKIPDNINISQWDNSPNVATNVPFPEPIDSSSESLQNSVTKSLSETLLETIEMSRQPTHLSEAFFKLNRIRDENEIELSEEEKRLLNESLDQLAFAVFYDTKQHILEPQYIVGPNETLTSIAAKYQITPEHLAALNSLSLPVYEPIAPGTPLKVVRGPVSAEVSFSKNELLLKFNNLYAGRFKMGCAEKARNQRGMLNITRKIQNPLYNGPINNGQWGQIAGGDSNNPLGPFWLELNNGLGLQGTNQPELVGTQTAQQGGLIFSNRDITHLNILLPIGTQINLVN